MAVLTDAKGKVYAEEISPGTWAQCGYPPIKVVPEVSWIVAHMALWERANKRKQ